MRTSLSHALLAAAALAACSPPPMPPEVPSAPDPIEAAPPPPAEAAPPGAAPGPAARETQEQRAARLHAEAILLDGHSDVPSLIAGALLDRAGPGREPTGADLARRKAGGITGELFSIHVNPALGQRAAALGGAARRALDLIDATYGQIERHGAELTLATSAGDLRRAKREGRVAALLGVEGGHAIENSLSALRSFYRLGVRLMTLTHLHTNDWADSAGGGLEPAIARHRGLSAFGEEVVREMQRIGMLVDVSHASDSTFRGVLKVAKAPVITTSSARAQGQQRRELDDDALRALAANGGVAVVNAWALFLDGAYAEQVGRFLQKHGARLRELGERHPGDPRRLEEEIERLRAQEAPIRLPPLSRIADHIDHLVKVAGVDHVALGADFDGMHARQGLAGLDGLPKITLELVRRGYSDEDILKILGGNFLRVLERAEAHAASTQTALSGDGSTRQLAPAELPPAQEPPLADVRPLVPPPAPSPKAPKPAAPPPGPPPDLDLILAR